MQARGDNIFSLMKAFANSSKLLTAKERESLRADASGSNSGRSLFFDYYAHFLVCHNLCSGFIWLIILFTQMLNS